MLLSSPGFFCAPKPVLLRGVIHECQTPLSALLVEHRDFNFSLIELAGMLGGVMKFKLLSQQRVCEWSLDSTCKCNSDCRQEVSCVSLVAFPTDPGKRSTDAR